MRAVQMHSCTFADASSILALLRCYIGNLARGNRHSVAFERGFNTESQLFIERALLQPCQRGWQLLPALPSSAVN